MPHDKAEVLATSASGQPTLIINGKALHSKYNPAKEAEQYIESLKISSETEYIILIECGLCYVIPALRKKLNAKIISLHISACTFNNVQHKANAIWYPQQKETLTNFLERTIEDTEAAKIKLIQWRPAIDIWGKEYINIFTQTINFIKLCDANKRTLKGFGKRWLKNTVKNHALIKNIVKINYTALNCIIAASGPSLQENIAAIKKIKERENAVLISVSSAAFALFQNGIKPDIIVTSDGGGWALNHLQECLRYDLGKTIIAAALNSALPSQYSSLHILPVADTSEYQNIILQNISADFLKFPQRGTVSAFAMDLASCICGGKILLCGMDLADNDIESHTAPYAFDLLLEKTACRLKPVYSEQFKRAFAVKEAGTFEYIS